MMVDMEDTTNRNRRTAIHVKNKGIKEAGRQEFGGEQDAENLFACHTSTDEANQNNNITINISNKAVQTAAYWKGKRI